jgi:hypothetical protein
VIAPRRPSLVGVLGSSVPGTGNPAGYKGVRTPERENVAEAGDRPVMLARPHSTLSPAWGKSGGSVSGRPTRESGDEQSSRGPRGKHVTVEGTPVRGMAAPFAGRRRNTGLGRWSTVGKGFLPCRRTRRGQRVSSGVRGGERHRHAPTKAHAPVSKGDEPLGSGRMTSFARSRDPCTSIVTTLRRRKSSEVARSKRDRGRANPGNREEPTPSLERTGVARLAVRRRSRKGGQLDASRKGRRLRPPSLRGSSARVWLPARRKRNVVAEVGRRRLASNKLVTRAPKRAVRVE